MIDRSAQLAAYLRRIPSVLGVVVRNRELGRVLGAYAGFLALEWGTWLTVIVYAYNQGGATTAGLVAFGQLVPAMLIAPAASVLGDRYRAGRVLAIAYLANGVAVGSMALAVLSDAPPPLVYALATISATLCSIVRPPLYALVPTLARSPIELTSANVTTGWVESVTVLVAPGLTGVLLGLSGTALALGVLGALGIGASVLAFPVTGPPPVAPEEAASASEQLTGGLRLVRDEREPRMLLVLLGGLYLGTGALDLLYAQIALGALDAGDAWAGYLNAAFGAGGALGIAATVAIVGRQHLTPPLIGAVSLWAASLCALALEPTKLTGLVLLALAGASCVLVDVTGRTLLQRAAPGDLVSRVFGMLEGVNSAGLAFGALLVPLCVWIGGTTAALLGTAAILPATLLLTWRRLREIDRTATVPIVEIGLLRSVPLFAPLSAPTLESIARSLEQLDVAAGQTVIRQGDPGDRWYVVADGTLRVERDGIELAELERGDGFGEIALLRDVPRTATVASLTPCVLYALEKDEFLEAVTGHPQVTLEVERVVDAHLTAHAERAAAAEADA